MSKYTTAVRVIEPGGPIGKGEGGGRGRGGGGRGARIISWTV